jgi:hypothetical protein
VRSLIEERGRGNFPPERSKEELPVGGASGGEDEAEREDKADI